MSILKILKFPNSNLKIKAKSVNILLKEDLNFINDLIETMFYYNALGIAATQVDKHVRIIVINISNDFFLQPLVLINPIILDKIGTVFSDEGCLSFPGFFIKVKRRDNVFFRFYTLNKFNVYFKSNSLFSICLQHEIDHINGITMYDRVSNVKKKIILKHFL